MKHTIIWIFTAVLTVLAAGCAGGAPGADTGHVTTGDTTARKAIKTKAPVAIPSLEGLMAEDVVRIDFYNGSEPEDTPARTFTEAEDIGRQLEMLLNIRLLREAGPAAATAPGDRRHYVLRCFDGRKIRISFAGGHVSFGEGHYAYDGESAPAEAKDRDLLVVQRLL